MRSRKSKLPSKRGEAVAVQAAEAAEAAEAVVEGVSEQQQEESAVEAGQQHSGSRKRLKRLSVLTAEERIRREVAEERQQLHVQAEQQDRELEDEQEQREQRQRAVRHQLRATGGRSGGGSGAPGGNDKNAARFAHFLRAMGV